jgi:hypothetical protein
MKKYEIKKKNTVCNIRMKLNSTKYIVKYIYLLIADLPRKANNEEHIGPNTDSFHVYKNTRTSSFK